MHEENCRSDTVLFQIKDAFRFQYQMSSCVIYFELLSTMNFAISFFLIFHIELELIFKIEIDENEIDFKCQALWPQTKAKWENDEEKTTNEHSSKMNQFDVKTQDIFFLLFHKCT